MEKYFIISQKQIDAVKKESPWVDKEGLPVEREIEMFFDIYTGISGEKPEYEVNKMKMSEDLKALFNKEIEAEVEKRIQEIPIRIKIDGVPVDIDSTNFEGGEVEIKVNKPFCTDGEPWS